MTGQSFNMQIVWFKRDLRLRDHEPLRNALQHNQPTLLIYIVEPSQLHDPHNHLKHWRFIWQSITDINQQLAAFNAKIYPLFGEAIDVLDKLLANFGSFTLYSHQEVGVNSTFKRDIEVSEWCKRNTITWHETPYAGVIRGAIHRDGWDEHWLRTMRRAPIHPPLANMLSLEAPPELWFKPPQEWTIICPHTQRGGEGWAWKTLSSFKQGRGKRFHLDISKPLAARKACSRLSPYLAWGNISMRESYQFFSQLATEPGWQRPMNAAVSRLHWHCHFIQKFESETPMEFAAVNAAYRDFPYRTDADVQADLSAWQTGMTGIPLIDACMRCVNTTGYLNFRMRAMLVSFLCHHLNIDWRLGVHHLARQFLDFEPGIHYPQFQMQASVTGINTIRIYNPVKQAQEHDPDGAFIKQWCPELSNIPVPLLFEPWQLSPMELTMYGLNLGEDYPHPIINIEESGSAARDRLWHFKARLDVKQEGQRILDRHVRRERA